ncbi:MAG: hypothetical protein ABW170_10585 [Candidatus Thiodiazotropha sp. L084R]
MDMFEGIPLVELIRLALKTAVPQDLRQMQQVVFADQHHSPILLVCQLNVQCMIHIGIANVLTIVEAILMFKKWIICVTIRHCHQFQKVAILLWIATVENCAAESVI